MASFENFRKHWIWAIIAFFITTIIAGVTMFLQYKSTQHELGGMLNATFHSRLLNNKDARTIVVCMEDTTIELEGLYVTPTFDNPAEYSLKDFNLSFDAVCTNVVPIPTSLVESHEYGKNEWLYKYKDNILAAHDDTKKIFSKFKVTDNKGRCYIKTKESHDGASSAFEYETDVWFIVEPNNKNLSFEDWKINCKKRIFEVVDEQFYDVYYFAKNHECDRQYDVALSEENDDSGNNVESVKDKKNYLHAAIVQKPITVTSPEVDKKSSTKLDDTDDNNNENEVIIENYEITNNRTSYDLMLYCKEELVEGEDYLLCYSSTDSLGEKRNYLHYTKSLGGRQIKICFSDLKNISDLRLLKKRNYEETINETIEGTKRTIRNITGNNVCCVIPYSETSITYQILGPGKSLVLEDSQGLPISVFYTGKNDLSFFEQLSIDSYSWTLTEQILFAFVVLVFFSLLLLGTAYICLREKKTETNPTTSKVKKNGKEQKTTRSDKGQSAPATNYRINNLIERARVSGLYSLSHLEQLSILENAPEEYKKLKEEFFHK